MQKSYTLLLLMVMSVSGFVKAQVNVTALQVPFKQNFNGLAASGTTNDISTLPQGWLFEETGTNANTTYAAGTGSSNAGNTYSFGLDASSDRALGGLLSGSLTPTIGASFVNNTSDSIASLKITFRGEQWRLGASGRGNDRIDFQYSWNASSLLTGTWTDVDALDFSSPVSVGTVGALIGDNPANNTTISYVITGLDILPGATFFIRWTDFNITSSDDGLAIDDFSLIAFGPITEPFISFSTAAVNFGEVPTGNTDIIMYEATAVNLDAPITVSVTNPVFSVSSNGSSFSSTTVLPDTGGVVYVRFSPPAKGKWLGSITHSSDTYSNTLPVSGNGFVQADNIIPIALARSKPNGTRVTVAGRITVANELGNPAYVQDNSGGIPVFDFALANGVEIGDSVLVTGPIGVFNDQKQISGGKIFFTRVETEKRFVSPKSITLPELVDNEGLLVTVLSVELVNKSFVFYPQSTERITDGTLQADLRIDGDTDIPGLAKPQSIIDITGVVGRFKSDAQLLPRFVEDVPGAEEPSSPTDSISKTTTLDVVTWNFEFFGAEKEDYGNEEFGPADELLQLQNIKQVLDSLEADIIAVEEVSDVSLFASLVQQLGKYSFSCSDRYSHSFDGPSNTFPPQKVCFIYDTTTVDLISTRVMFENLYDSARTVVPSMIPGYPGGNPSNFYASGRLPYLLTANITIEGVTETISLIVLHAKSGATANDHSRREYDATVLKDSLDSYFNNELFIVLGDLNDDLDQSIAPGLPSPYAAFVNDAERYDPITKVLSDAGVRSTVGFNDMIDHQIISNDLHEEYLPGSAQVVAPFRFIPNYASTTSDHLPVITRYTFQAPVASFVQNSVELTEEDSTNYTVSIVLSKPLTNARQISISLTGNASHGDDFVTEPTAVNGTITLDLTPGDSTASFTITVINDSEDELTESVAFTLQPGNGIEIGDPSIFTLTLEDNDIPSISFAELHACAVEGSGPYAIRLKLSTIVASEQTVKIYIFAKHKVDYGTDYVTEPAAIQNTITLTVPAGSSEVSFQVIPLLDRKHEKPGETVAFFLAETTEGITAIKPRISLFTILDARKKPHFVVFPNPTLGWIRLLCDELDDDEIIHVELHHQNGELLYRGSGTLRDLSEILSHKLRSSKKGVYVLKLVIDEESYMIRIANQ